VANSRPSFVTGANARLKIDSKTIAYASDVSYRIIVDIVPVETMGRYEAVSIEPIAYTVSGELSIVRYTKAAVAATGITPINGVNVAGNNGVGAMGLNTHFDPNTILASSTVDVEIFELRQQAGTVNTARESSSITKVIDCRFTNKSSTINKRGIWVERFTFVGVLAEDDSFPSGVQNSDTGTDLA